MDSLAVMVSDIHTQADVAVVSSLLDHGRTSVVDQDMADIDGMLHIRKVFTGMRRRTVIRATGPNSFHVMRNLNSESSDIQSINQSIYFVLLTCYGALQMVVLLLLLLAQDTIRHQSKCKVETGMTRLIALTASPVY